MTEDRKGPKMEPATAISTADPMGHPKGHGTADPTGHPKGLGTADPTGYRKVKMMAAQTVSLTADPTGYRKVKMMASPTASSMGHRARA